MESEVTLSEPRLIVQIYEIQTPEEAEACIDLGVDHVGSVVLEPEQWKESRLKEVVRVVREAGAKASLIPLFRDLDLILKVIDYYEPHLIHLCDSLTTQGNKTVELEPFLRTQQVIKERCEGVGIIRSIPIPTREKSRQFPTIEIARRFEELTDIFLTDTTLGREPVDGFIGITGILPDLDLARELVVKVSRPVILAGGLSPDNVYDAIIKVRPAGADSCTWTNLTDSQGKPIRFRKDLDKVKRFVQEVRRAEEALKSIHP